MKKSVFLLALLMVLFLCGCWRTGPLRYDEDTFFYADWLSEYDLSDLPKPKLENSRLTGSILYLNLTREEYEAYATEVITYLQERPDICNLCSFHSKTLMFGAFPKETYIPLPEDYDLAGNHQLAFSMTKELNEGAMAAPIRINILWEAQGMHWNDGFSYNTQIMFIPNDNTPIHVDPCAAQHTYDEGTAYPIPGWERSITRYTCIYCGDTKQSEYLDSRKSYAVTVAQGRNYILSNNWNQVVAWDIDSLHAGGTLEITVRRATTGSTALLVNGESIPVLREDENTQTFGFIMPESDVTIEIFPTETE